MRPLNRDEGKLGDKSGDSQDMLKFIVVDTAIGRRPSFTISPGLNTLKTSEKQFREGHNPFRGAFRRTLSKGIHQIRGFWSIPSVSPARGTSGVTPK
jgi:hypothetical protein